MKHNEQLDACGGNRGIYPEVSSGGYRNPSYHGQRAERKSGKNYATGEEYHQA